MSNTIVFFFLTKNVKSGGVQFLFANLVRELRGNNFNLCIMSEKDSIMRDLIGGDQVRYIIFNPRKNILPDNATVIMPFEYVNLSGLIEGKNLRFLFWSLFDKSMLWVEQYKWILVFQWVLKKNLSLKTEKLLMYLLGYSLWKKLKLFLDLASQKNGLVYMDKYHVSYNQEYFDISLKDNTLPICVEIPPYRYKVLKNSTTINVCWLGRLVDFKIPSLKILIVGLYDFCKKHPEKKIQLFIVGTGNRFNDIKKFAILFKSENFKIQFKDEIYGSSLGDFLNEEIDLVCAHGTSVLEGAKWGIPSLLLLTPFLFKDDKVKEMLNITKCPWIFECEEGYVGSIVKPSQGNTLEEALNQFLIDPTIGLKCYKHVDQYFNIRTHAFKLIEKINKTKLTKKDIEYTGITNHLLWFRLIYFFRKLSKLCFSGHQVLFLILTKSLKMTFW